MQSEKWQLNAPLRMDADVAVIGGGIAGVCAACAAAREGAQVVLVEKFAVTGGNATVGGVANWCGETKGQGALFDEILDLQAEWNAVAPYPGPYRHFTGIHRVFDHEILMVILQELLLKHGVRVLLHTQFVTPRCEDGRISEVLINGLSGPETLRAKVFVDCTGDGLVGYQAGFATERGGVVRGLPLPPSMMFFVRETNGPVEPQLPEGWFEPVRRREDLPMTSPWPNGPGGKAIKVKVIGFDNTDTEGISALEMRARRRMFEVLDYYQRVEKRPWLFDHASPIIGLREGRRIVGDYTLNLEDIRNRRVFDDAVARGVYQLDGMSPDSEKREYLLSEEERAVPPYQIPLRCLIARDGVNLLMAGRCLSSDQHALSSARTMTTCAMMGQAAGLTGALAVRHGGEVRRVAATTVRQKLESTGAYLSLDDFNPPD